MTLFGGLEERIAARSSFPLPPLPPISRSRPRPRSVDLVDLGFSPGLSLVPIVRSSSIRRPPPRTTWTCTILLSNSPVTQTRTYARQSLLLIDCELTLEILSAPQNTPLGNDAATRDGLDALSHSIRRNHPCTISFSRIEGSDSWLFTLFGALQAVLAAKAILLRDSPLQVRFLT